MRRIKSKNALLAITAGKGTEREPQNNRGKHNNHYFTRNLDRTFHRKLRGATKHKPSSRIGSGDRHRNRFGLVQKSKQILKKEDRVPAFQDIFESSRLVTAMRALSRNVY